MTYSPRQKAGAHAKYRRRQEAIAAIKVARGCVDCGYDQDSCALDFDHVRGEKSFSIAKNILGNWDRILREIEKCDVRCANCHRIKTRDRLNGRESP